MYVALMKEKRYAYSISTGMMNEILQIFNKDVAGRGWSAIVSVMITKRPLWRSATALQYGRAVL